MISILDVPQEWLPKNTFQYPPHQGQNPLIEERAYSFFTDQNKNFDTEYTYIPIQWTMYHCSNNWGNDTAKIAEMQSWMNNLAEHYPDKKFFTVVQYDDGTLVSIKNCCGCTGDDEDNEYFGFARGYIARNNGINKEHD